MTGNGMASKAADFTGLGLTRAGFIGRDLTEADFTGANLTGADFTGAKLRRVKLQEADLTGANFTDACLFAADLRWVDLTGANLTRADFTEVKIPIESFFKANNWEQAKNIDEAYFYYEDQKIHGFSFDENGNITIKLKGESLTEGFHLDKKIHITDIPADELKQFSLPAGALKAIAAAAKANTPTNSSGATVSKPKGLEGGLS